MEIYPDQVVNQVLHFAVLWENFIIIYKCSIRWTCVLTTTAKLQITEVSIKYRIIYSPILVNTIATLRVLTHYNHLQVREILQDLFQQQPL